MTGGTVTESVITCPHCGRAEREMMPADACQYLYDCKGCGRILTPLDGNCCVFCSYGDTPCPPAQLQGRAVGCHTEQNVWAERLRKVATDPGPSHSRHARLIALVAAMDQELLAIPAEARSRLRTNLSDLCSEEAEKFASRGWAHAAEIMSTTAKLVRHLPDTGGPDERA